jgi:hypothetical protein
VSVATFAQNTSTNPITYTASLMDESIPGSWWISVATGGTVSGTSSAGETTYVKVRATYTQGSTYTCSAIKKVIVTNTAPAISATIPDQSSAVNTVFSFGFSSSAFTDASSGDSISYTAELSSGSVLPSWLSFDSANRLFSGTPVTATTYSIRVIATDMGGSTASDVFIITTTNNDPVVGTAIANQILVVGEAFSYNTPSSAFTDANGHAVSYVSATQTDLSALPTWMSYSTASGLFVGTPTGKILVYDNYSCWDYFCKNNSNRWIWWN